MHGDSRRTTPRFIECGQHGESCTVTAQRILTLTDGRRALFAFGTCGERTSLRPHEFGEFVYYIDEAAA